MSDDMRLLTLTHLRAALERKDWRQVEKARQLCLSSRDDKTAHCLLRSLELKDWRALEAVYVSLGGTGCGEPAKGAGDPATARQMGVREVRA